MLIAEKKYACSVIEHLEFGLQFTFQFSTSSLNVLYEFQCTLPPVSFVHFSVLILAHLCSGLVFVWYEPVPPDSCSPRLVYGWVPACIGPQPLYEPLQPRPCLCTLFLQNSENTPHSNTINIRTVLKACATILYMHYRGITSSPKHWQNNLRE